MSEHSSNTANFEVDGDKYVIMLLSTQAAFKMQFFLGNQIKSAMGEKGIDPELMWSLAEKLLKFAEVNNHPLDIEKHFFGKVEVLDRVVIESLKANLPGFTKQLSALAAQWIKKVSASASDTSGLTTSESATATSEQPSSP